jgi:hypothetical protein
VHHEQDDVGVVGVELRRLGDQAADVAAHAADQRLRVDLADHRAGARGGGECAEALDPFGHEVDGRTRAC